jgi:hypothetical protein
MASALHKGSSMTSAFGRVAFAVGLVIVLSRTAGAVTIDQIVALTKAGVAEPVILALIDRDKTVFTIDPEQLVRLQRDGVSQAVIVAMLKSGRAEGDAQARADSAEKSALILSSLAAVPDVVVLGHGPDYPNVVTNFYSAPPPVSLLPVPYGFPYALPYAANHVPRERLRRDAAFPLAPAKTSPALCFAHPSSGPVPPMVGSMGFVTVCPQPLQPNHLR